MRIIIEILAFLLSLAMLGLGCMGYAGGLLQIFALALSVGGVILFVLLYVIYKDKQNI